MLVTLVLLAVAVAAVPLFWGSWVWMAVAAAVAVVEFVTLRRSARFSARLWRVAPGRRHRREERAVETAYLVSAGAGLVLFVVACLAILVG